MLIRILALVAVMSITPALGAYGETNRDGATDPPAVATGCGHSQRENWPELLAILVGPLLAVFVTRLNDERRARDARRMDVFRVLMRTRRMRLSPDHVGALNLVEIEFKDDKAVIEAWKKYFGHLSSYPTAPTAEEDRKLDEEAYKLLSRLLHALAKVLGFEMEQFDILEGGYAPRGWELVETEAQVSRRLLLALLEGKQPLRVVLIPSANPSPFPPAPAPATEKS